MNLGLNRSWFTSESTGGSLGIDGVFQAYTLEPRKDQSQGKPFCIPCGTFPVALLWSEKHQRIVPHILNVPNFTAVEMHPGNDSADTEACVLVGQTRDIDWVGNSDLAFEALMGKLQGQENISITITEEPQGEASETTI